MRCEHGKKIRVVITTESELHWDSGIKMYDEDGKYHYIDGNYLLVEGCDKCSTIKVKFGWD